MGGCGNAGRGQIARACPCCRARGALQTHETRTSDERVLTLGANFESMEEAARGYVAGGLRGGRAWRRVWGGGGACGSQDLATAWLVLILLSSTDPHRPRLLIKITARPADPANQLTANQPTHTALGVVQLSSWLLQRATATTAPSASSSPTP